MIIIIILICIRQRTNFYYPDRIIIYYFLLIFFSLIPYSSFEYLCVQCLVSETHNDPLHHLESLWNGF